MFLPASFVPTWPTGGNGGKQGAYACSLRWQSLTSMADTHVGDSALPSLTSMFTVVWGMLHHFVFGFRPFYIGGPPIVPKKRDLGTLE